MVLPLNKSLVHPHLKYAAQFWSPPLRKGIEKIVNIQQKITKMIPEIRNHSYCQWINYLKLIRLIQTRLPGQIIEVFKYLNRLYLAPEPVQGGSLIMTPMTEQETMVQKLSVKHLSHQLHNIFTQLKLQ